jgi:hypothetical protein
VERIKDHLSHRLVLPIEFKISKKDLENLENLEITIIQNPLELTLKESIHLALKKILPKCSPIRILHGDTFFSELPLDVDLINVSEAKSQQSWFSEEAHFNGKNVWSGYFAFSDHALLMSCLEKETNFETAVLLYEKKHSLRRNFSCTWEDLGHAATYYLARQNLLVSRSFNRLQYKNGVLEKSGETSKIRAEVFWYKNIPLQLRKYVPQIVGDVEEELPLSYSMEYLPLSALSEILVYGNQPMLFWEESHSLLGKLLDILRKCEITESNWINNLNSTENFSEHVTKRLTSLERSQCPISQDHKIVVNNEAAVSIRQIILECLEIIGKGKAIPAVIHGDLCLSNVLFESRMNQIRIIDPRGQDFDGKETIFGDQRYDLAKLAQSFMGHYDYIIAGFFYLEDVYEGGQWNANFKIENPDFSERIADNFYAKFIENQPYRDDVFAIVILLFITMTPLHSEDSQRQLAFLYNSVLLYHRFFGASK